MADAAAVEHRATGVGRPVALGLISARPPSRLPLKEHLTGVFPVLRQGSDEAATLAYDDIRGE